MKNLLLSVLCFILSSGFMPVEEGIYQVITAHPHDLERLTPHVNTLKRDGRFWAVTLKKSFPASLRGIVKKIQSHEIEQKSYEPVVLEINPTIIHAIKLVETNLLKSDVEKLSSYKTRIVGSADNKLAINWSEQKLKAMGYKTKQICFEPSKCSVIADKINSNSSEVILVEAHLDSVGKDFAGADDNASGTASLLEMARVLSGISLNSNLRFFITNGEESGLEGAKHYVKQLDSRNELRFIKLVINMDMVGYNSNGVVELETDSPFEGLAKEFVDLAATYTTLKTKVTIGAWGSDHVPFLEKDIPTLLTIEDWSTKTPCYHASCDKPDTVNYLYATEITKLNIAAVLKHDLN
ncbi:MAG: Zn-dependent exopeptidase M28 [Bacteriovoracaceae bacterium]|nr:Zn-dependent exopeptidase M28 [Bacteriovoracaceae bacterium]